MRTGKIFLVFLAVFLLGSMIFASNIVISKKTKKTEKTSTNPEQYCLDRGHELKCYTYSSGKYCYCYDKYGNECWDKKYYSGECKLFEGFKKKDRRWLRLSRKKNFNRKITKCSKDKQCKIVSTTRCPCNEGGNQVAVNKLGKKYWDWYRKTFYLGNYYCIQSYNCKYKEAYCDKKTKTCKLR